MAQGKLLIIEDDESLRSMYQQRLEAGGYEVLVAPDGESGTDLALEQRPDLILLDLMLPRRGGLSVIKILKSWPNTKTIPIVVITNYGREEYKLEALRDGATHFMLKTDVTPQQVVEKIGDILGNRKKEDGARR